VEPAITPICQVPSSTIRRRPAWKPLLWELPQSRPQPRPSSTSATSRRWYRGAQASGISKPHRPLAAGALTPNCSGRRLRNPGCAAHPNGQHADSDTACLLYVGDSRRKTDRADSPVARCHCPAAVWRKSVTAPSPTASERCLRQRTRSSDYMRRWKELASAYASAMLSCSPPAPKPWGGCAGGHRQAGLPWWVGATAAASRTSLPRGQRLSHDTPMKPSTAWASANSPRAGQARSVARIAAGRPLQKAEARAGPRPPPTSLRGLYRQVPGRSCSWWVIGGWRRSLLAER